MMHDVHGLGLNSVLCPRCCVALTGELHGALGCMVHGVHGLGQNSEVPILMLHSVDW